LSLHSDVSLNRQFLVVYINLFSFNRNTNEYDKIKTKINSLDSDCLSLPSYDQSSVRFRLVTLVVHIGNTI